MKFRLEPNRRAELMTSFIELQAKLFSIAREIGSTRMEERTQGVGEAFYDRLREDKNIKKSADVEAEMDDNSGDEEVISSHED